MTSSDESRTPLALRVCGCISADEGPVDRARTQLESAFGPLSMRSDTFPFDLTDYYEKEMGRDLARTWLIFEELMSPLELVEFKRLTSGVEEMLGRPGGGRTINLDPGYLDLGKLVLASGKEAPDKLYIGDGVWAHTCLRYRSGGLRAPDHSFPDFRSGLYDGFFLEARLLLKRMLRA